MEFKTEIEMFHSLYDLLQETWPSNESDRIKAFKKHCLKIIESKSKDSSINNHKLEV